MSRLAPLVMVAVLGVGLAPTVAAEELPDLDGWAGPQDIEPGVPVRFEGVVFSFTDGDVAPFDIDIFADGALVETLRIESMPASRWVEFTTTATFTGAEGPHTSGWTIDARDEVAESNESNNAWTYDLAFRSRRADVAVDVLGSRETGEPLQWPLGATVLDYRVCNVGDAAMDGEAHITIDLYTAGGAYNGFVSDSAPALGIDECVDRELRFSQVARRGERGFVIYAFPLDYEDGYERDRANNRAEGRVHQGPVLPVLG